MADKESYGTSELSSPSSRLLFSISCLPSIKEQCSSSSLAGALAHQAKAEPASTTNKFRSRLPRRTFPAAYLPNGKKKSSSVPASTTGSQGSRPREETGSRSWPVTGNNYKKKNDGEEDLLKRTNTKSTLFSEVR